jgi:class 3 adenylate cyclase
MGWGEGGAVLWDKLLEVALFNIAGPTIGILADMERKQRAEKEFISNTFGRYVDRDIARELMSRPEAVRLGGEKREVAILFSDLRDFTSISEPLTPEATIMMLNRYFSHMIEVIQRHKGIVVDFFGDGLLVFFDPLEGPLRPTAHRAIRCALGMQRQIESFNSEMKRQQLPELEMGIGLNVGQVVVGNIGSETRAKYGIVGSAVNATERIQGVARGGEVALSDSIFEHSEEFQFASKTIEKKLKGIQERTSLHIIDCNTPPLARPASES